MTSRAWLVVAALATASPLVAQRLDRLTFWDMQMSRSRDPGGDDVIQLRAGATGVKPDDEDPDQGLEQDITFDGFGYYHAGQFGGRQAVVDGYAGTDGVLLSIQDAQTVGSNTRLELSWRYMPFYREGFYTEQDQWAVTGRYQGDDYGAYLGVGTAPGSGTVMEAGPFYKRYNFERNEYTANSYVTPEDFNAYGFRTYFEQNVLQLDREYNEPMAGFLATARLDLEFNDSSKSFGTPLYTTTLASEYWRFFGHLEWYFPLGSLGAVQWTVDGMWTDSKDRIVDNDTIKPLGYIWGDTTVGLRMRFGPIRVTPFGQLQYTKTLNETGSSSLENWWFGGGLRTRFDFGDSFFVYADYSYMNNPNRPSVTFEEDLWGEHQFFAGAEVRFGGGGE